jgi:hypothetical protein
MAKEKSDIIYDDRSEGDRQESSGFMRIIFYALESSIECTVSLSGFLVAMWYINKFDSDS